MPALALPVTGLTDFLSSRYAACGAPSMLVPLNFEFPVSNSLFQYATAKGRFLLKATAHPRALYGQPDAVERLEVVGTALSEMHRAGLPVEEIVCGDDGRYVGQYDDHLLRLYVFDAGRPFSGSEQDCRRGARALHRLHAEGLSSLREETRVKLSRFTKSYPLRATAAELRPIRLFVAEKAHRSPTYATILDHWGTVEWAVDRALAGDLLESDAGCLVHTDFHPRNALFNDGRDEATMIDFDNMLIDRRLTCLGFSILRFGFYSGARTPRTLHRAIMTFAGEDEPVPGFRDRLIHAMVYIEIEKVLRIIQRVRTTGQYAGFLENICPIHLTNLDLLRTSFIRES